MFYPVSALPGWLQPLAFLVPASHVFEAVRTFFVRGDVLVGALVWALVLDAIYLAGAAALAAAAFTTVRRRGLLSRPGY